MYLTIFPPIHTYQRSAPRKRRHQRGKSGGDNSTKRDSVSPTRSIKKQDRNIIENSQDDQESLHVWREREPLTHHKSKSDGNILMWFDEIKQRRASRFKQVPDLYGYNKTLENNEEGIISSATHLSLVFSQPQEWVFGNTITDLKDTPTLEDKEYAAEKMERKKWQDWAHSAVRL
jgi:hypothetical protein